MGIPTVYMSVIPRGLKELLTEDHGAAGCLSVSETAWTLANPLTWAARSAIC